jgi:hypothetical protein
VRFLNLEEGWSRVWRIALVWVHHQREPSKCCLDCAAGAGLLEIEDSIMIRRTQYALDLLALLRRRSLAAASACR